jgi:hypothetical protein
MHDASLSAHHTNVLIALWNGIKRRNASSLFFQHFPVISQSLLPLIYVAISYLTFPSLFVYLFCRIPFPCYLTVSPTADLCGYLLSHLPISLCLSLLSNSLSLLSHSLSYRCLTWLSLVSPSHLSLSISSVEFPFPVISQSLISLFDMAVSCLTFPSLSISSVEFSLSLFSHRLSFR